jgi:phasin family protein
LREEDNLAAKKAVTAPARNVARTSAPPIETPETVVMAAPIVDVVAPSPIEDEPTTHAMDLPALEAPLTSEITELKTEAKYTMENAIKSTEEIVSFGQGNVEAIMKSSQIWATGVQDLGKHFAATAQAQLDETMATVKALSSVKSLKEAMEIQSTLAKTAMEKMLAETGKLTDASMKLAEQAMAPITARVTLATEKFGRTV